VSLKLANAITCDEEETANVSDNKLVLVLPASQRSAGAWIAKMLMCSLMATLGNAFEFTAMQQRFYRVNLGWRHQKK